MLARSTGGNVDARVDGGLEPGGIDPHGLIYQLLASPGSRTYGGYSNARMDYVLINAVKATDLKARAVNYRAAQQILQADRPVIPLYNRTTLAATSASVTGVALLGDGSVSLAYAQYK